MSRRGTVLSRILEAVVAELIKKGYHVEFLMTPEEGYIKWNLKKNGK